jgi:lactoylglutathione lyase
MKISLLVIRCKDIEKSREFYERLGMVFMKEKHGAGLEHYSAQCEGSVFELYQNKDESLSENIRLGFNVDSLEILESLSVASSYEFDGKITYVVVDPYGRKVELSK